MSTVTIEFLAGSYGVMMSLAPFLQARRMWLRRSSVDVSVPYLGVLLVGFMIYLVYGTSIGNRVLITTNTVSVIATAITLAIAIRYRQTSRCIRRP